MSIGSHRLGKLFMDVRASATNGFRWLYTSQSKQELPVTQPFEQDGVTADQLPAAPKNPYRKRPVKLVYHKNDFHMFRLPSEKSFLLSSFNYNELFGEKKGMSHAPHIRSQMDLDTNVVLVFLGLTLGLLLWEPGRTHKLVTLRENMRNSDMGYFEEDDFKN